MHNSTKISSERTCSNVWDKQVDGNKHSVSLLQFQIENNIESKPILMDHYFNLNFIKNKGRIA